MRFHYFRGSFGGLARAREAWMLAAGAILLGAAFFHWSPPWRLAGSSAFFVLEPAPGLPDERGIYPAGARLMWIDLEAGGRVLDAAPGWSVTSPPAVSFDGRKVLFSGRRRGDRWVQIWELERGSGRPRQVTSFAGECSHPHYLPDGRVVFSGRRSGRCLLFTQEPGRSEARPITFGKAEDFARAILKDGRILFERFLASVPGVAPRRWMTINSDGTGLALYAARGDSPPPGQTGEVRLLSACPDGSRELALFRLDPGSGERRLLFRREGFHVLNPSPAQVRPRPAVQSSVVDRDRGVGWLLCLDAYLTSRGGAPLRLARRLDSVRVLDAASGELLGLAPIEEDGSFFLEVPADRLLQLETVDAGGRVVARLRSGVWVRPNEHRGCLGCHEPARLAPENRTPLALRREPARISGKAPPPAGREVKGSGQP